MLSFVLVFAIGFAAHRASLCTVRAVMQWLEKRKASVIVSFLKAAAWASLLAGVFVLFGLSIKGVPQTNGVWWLGILGGFVFGIGAAVNGGCSLSTLQQLADGDSGMLLAIAGFVFGAAGVTAIEHLWLAPVVQARSLWWQGFTPPQQVLLVGLLTAWAAGELAVMWLGRDRSKSVWQRLGAGRYRLSFSALILGVASGLLFLLEGAWTYTNYLRGQTMFLLFGVATPGWNRGLLAMALFLGMVASSLQRRSFRWCWPTAHDSLKRGIGGALMGAGGGLVPGGNDTLLLVLIPTLSPQAIATYVALLIGIGGVVLFMRRSAGAARPKDRYPLRG